MGLSGRSVGSTGNKGRGGNKFLLMISYKARDESRELELEHGKETEDNLHACVARGVSRKTG